MLRRIAACASLLALSGATAYAAEEQPKDQPVDMECIQQLIRAEKLVEGKIETLSEADQEKAFQYLDDADAFCTEGNARQARKALAAVKELVSEAKE